MQAYLSKAKGIQQIHLLFSIYKNWAVIRTLCRIQKDRHTGRHSQTKFHPPFFQSFPEEKQKSVSATWCFTLTCTPFSIQSLDHLYWKLGIAFHALLLVLIKNNGFPSSATVFHNLGGLHRPSSFSSLNKTVNCLESFYCPYELWFFQYLTILTKRPSIIFPLFGDVQGFKSYHRLLRLDLQQWCNSFSRWNQDT